MTTFTKVLKSGVGPKLVPFFKTLAIYFVIFIPADQPSLFGALLKALPVLSLIGFVLLHGMSFGDEYLYSRRVLLGLLCSVVGDVLLVWEPFFLHGLSVFLIAQLFYIAAFGFTPFNMHAAAAIYGVMVAGLWVLLPQIEGALRIGVAVYTFTLTTMMWRAVSRVQLLSELYTWTKLCSCVGGVLFTFSDACIGFHHFYSPIPYSQLLIMTSYYAAQLCIALSVVDCKASYLDALKQRQDGTRRQHNCDMQQHGQHDGDMQQHGQHYSDMQQHELHMQQLQVVTPDDPAVASSISSVNFQPLDNETLCSARLDTCSEGAQEDLVRRRSVPSQSLVSGSSKLFPGGGEAVNDPAKEDEGDLAAAGAGVVRVTGCKVSCRT